MSKRLDLKAFREENAEYTPEEMTEMLGVMMEAAAEIARELKIPPAAFARTALECWAEAHGKTIEKFEEIDEEVGTELLVGMATRWVSN